MLRNNMLGNKFEQDGMCWECPLHSNSRYENMPIQIYWKFYHQKMKIFR